MGQQETELSFKVSDEMVSLSLLGRSLSMPMFFLHGCKVFMLSVAFYDLSST